MTIIQPSAPSMTDQSQPLPPAQADTFKVASWPTSFDVEPKGMTRLRQGETYLDGVKRLADRNGVDNIIRKGCNTYLPGMRVARDQVGVMTCNGQVNLCEPGKYISSRLYPNRKDGAVIPIRYQAGQEFNPVQEAARENRNIADLQLGNSYRMRSVGAGEAAIFKDSESFSLQGFGTYVYGPEVLNTGAFDFNQLTPVQVTRITEDIAAAQDQTSNAVRAHTSGSRTQPQQAFTQTTGHNTTVATKSVRVLAGYYDMKQGIKLVKPASGFTALHRDADGQISMNEGITVAVGEADFVRDADGSVEFGDMNEYARSTPMLKMQTNDNFEVRCQTQIKWKQTRPDIWVNTRGGAPDPYDMLEEELVGKLRDWLQKTSHQDAIREKSTAYSSIEHEMVDALNKTAAKYGVEVVQLQITALTLPDVEKHNRAVAQQKVETDYTLTGNQQEILKVSAQETLNAAKHRQLESEKNRSIEAEESAQKAQQRANLAQSTTDTVNAENQAKVVEAQKALQLAQESKLNAIKIAQAESHAATVEIEAQAEMSAAKLKAAGNIAHLKEQQAAELEYLQSKQNMLAQSPQLLELLELESREKVQLAFAEACKVNTRLAVGLSAPDTQELRVADAGYAPRVAQLSALNGPVRSTNTSADA